MGKLKEKTETKYFNKQNKGQLSDVCTYKSEAVVMTYVKETDTKL